jgi:serine protease inhibitor
MEAFILYIIIVMHGSITINTEKYDTYETCATAKKFAGQLLRDIAKKEGENNEVYTFCTKK